MALLAASLFLDVLREVDGFRPEPLWALTQQLPVAQAAPPFALFWRLHAD